MRIVKQRLLEMIPELVVFLDVDDLEDIENLGQYIERTSTVLVFCSQGYFQSKNVYVDAIRPRAHSHGGQRASVRPLGHHRMRVPHRRCVRCV